VRRLFLFIAVAVLGACPVTPASCQSTAPIRYGDLDGDGRVSLHDARLAILAALKMPPYADASYPQAADVAPLHNDGTFGDGAVDASDVLRILRYVVGLDRQVWPGVYAFGFEAGMDGWQPNGADLEDPPVQWQIQRSTDTASQGNASLKLFLNNLNDAGKIWVQRPFAVEPYTRYAATVTYKLASSDVGDINAWTLIGAALPHEPGAAGDLQPLGSTALGGRPAPYWLDGSFTQQVFSGPDGVVWIAVGVWGTYEVARTYYLDDVRVSLAASPASANTVSGRVSPAAGAVVCALRRSGKGPAEVAAFAFPQDKQGNYVLAGLPDGEYWLMASSTVASPVSLPQPIAVSNGASVKAPDIRLDPEASLPRQVDRTLTVPMPSDAPFVELDVPILVDEDGPEGLARMDVRVDSSTKGTADVGLTLRYPKTSDFAIDEVIAYIELKVWSGDTLVDYLPVDYSAEVVDPLNPGDTIEVERSVRIPTSGQSYALEVVVWGNYE